jgi:hypothetical protein
MNPFQSHKGPAAAIPSGDNENFVVIDNFMYDDITAVTGATFFIQTLPMLPVTAVISSISAAGTHDLNINNVNFLSSGNTNWGNYPIGVVTPYRALTLTPGIAVDDPYQSVSARMVSIGYKLTYTGQSATCSGTVTVTPNNVGFTLAGSLTASTGNIASPSAVSGNLANSAQTATVAAPLGSPILTIDLTNVVTAYTKDSVIFRPEEGVLILPRHRTKDFKIVSTSDIPYFLAANQSVGGTVAGTVLQNFYTTYGVGAALAQNAIWYDQDWSAVQIVIAGVQPLSTFRLETVVCTEYVLPSSSPFAPLALKSSPDNPASIKAVNKMMSSMAIASPTHSYQGFNQVPR